MDDVRDTLTSGWLRRLKKIFFPRRRKRLNYYRYCSALFRSGTGLEVGGPSRIFRRKGLIPVYSVARKIDNCNFDRNTVWEGAIREGESFVFNKARAPGRQYIAEASDLRGIESGAYDFVLSSHCIEHLANPLRGLAEWIRVLKPDGLLVLVVPHKDGTFDHRRPVTTLQHLIDDFDQDMDESDLTHLDEILELHDFARDPASGTFEFFRERSSRNWENRCLHQHVFDTRLAVEVVHYMGLQIQTVELFRPYHIVVVAKKVKQNQVIDNEKFRGLEVPPCWVSPFPSDELIRGAAKLERTGSPSAIAK